MRFTINKSQIDIAPEQFLRRVGYGYIRDHRTGHDSFVRRLGSNFYPRLHMYAEEKGEQIIFNLHLDQKQASYPGAHMHNAEYDGAVVAEEMARLKSLVPPSAHRLSPDDVKEEDLLNKIRPGELPEKSLRPDKKSWWRKLFGF